MVCEANHSDNQQFSIVNYHLVRYTYIRQIYVEYTHYPSFVFFYIVMY